MSDKKYREEIFAQVANHLIKQGKKSVRRHRAGGYACRYRSGELSCAVGCLITDEAYVHYSTMIEGKPVEEPIVLDALIRSGIKVDDGVVRMLSKLQEIHDGYDPEVWGRELSLLAEHSNIKWEYSK